MKRVYLVIGTENDGGWAFDSVVRVFESLNKAQEFKTALELEEVYEDVRIEPWNIN